MATGDGATAWACLRLSGDYRAAWNEHAARPRYEDGAPFPLRLRSEADRIAARDWSLLAWEDPDGDALSAFFADAPMLEAAGAHVEGLRLDDGALILKVKAAGMAVQVRIADPAPLLAGGGVRLFHDWGLALPVAIARLGDLWSVSGGDPRRGVGGRAHRVESGAGAPALGSGGSSVAVETVKVFW